MTSDKPFGGYETAQDVVDAVAAGAIVRTEIVENALLAIIGRDFAINFDSPAARASLEVTDEQAEVQSARGHARPHREP